MAMPHILLLCPIHLFSWDHPWKLWDRRCSYLIQAILLLLSHLFVFVFSPVYHTQTHRYKTSIYFSLSLFLSLAHSNLPCRLLSHLAHFPPNRNTTTEGGWFWKREGRNRYREKEREREREETRRDREREREREREKTNQRKTDGETNHSEGPW